MSRLVEMIQAIARHEQKRRTYCELALVTSTFDDADGDDSHSVSVKLKDSGLALTRLPMASSVTGAAALPRQGDVVLVAVPRGDLSSAVVVGQVYSDQRRPPVFSRDEVALVWPGDTDEPDKKAVDVRIASNGSTRSLTVSLGGDKDATVSITDGEIHLNAGGVRIKLAHSSDSDGSVQVAAGGTSVELAQDGDLKIQSAGKLSLKAASIAIEGDTEVKINGQTVGIN